MDRCGSTTHAFEERLVFAQVGGAVVQRPGVSACVWSQDVDAPSIVPSITAVDVGKVNERLWRYKERRDKHDLPST